MAFEMLDVEEADEVFEQKPRVYKGGPVGPRERKDDQKPWDENVAKAFRAGKPFAVQVTPEQADQARKYVNSACRYQGLAATEGLPKPGKVEGTVILAWKLRVPKKRSSKSETVAQEVDPETSAE